MQMNISLEKVFLQWNKFSKKKYLFSLKNYLPCPDLNLGPPEYQADAEAWMVSLLNTV